MIDPDGMAADTGKVKPTPAPTPKPTSDPATVVPLIPALAPVVEAVAAKLTVVLEEVVITGTRVATAGASAVGLTLGAIFLPQNWQQEWRYSDFPEGHRPNIPPPPIIPPHFFDKASEHTKGARPSTLSKHQKGQARKVRDRGGEKGERLPPRKKPPGHKGPWPPKN